MTKKNLSDLLREEAGSPADQPAASPAPKAAPAGQSKTTGRTTARRGPTKADLEKQVTDLTASLAAAEGREAALQTQLDSLQTDLDAQQTRLFELKDCLETAAAATQEKDTTLAQVTAELAAAKQAIASMTQAAQAVQAAPPAPPPAPLSPPPAPPPPQAERAPLSVRMGSPPLRRGPARGIPEYAIQRGEKTPIKNTMLSDDDIGWVD